MLNTEGKDSKMPNYTVQVNELIIHTVSVEADSRHEAKQKGYEIVMNGPDTEYDSQSEGTQAIYVYEEEAENG